MESIDSRGAARITRIFGTIAQGARGLFAAPCRVLRTQVTAGCAAGGLVLALATAYAAPPAPPRKAALREGEPELKDRHTDEELFAGKVTQSITLHRAIEMALENNLEARFERVGINIQRAQVRFAAGAFDPVFSLSGQKQSIRVPEDINNPSTAQAIQSQQQLQLQLNQAAQQLNAEQINSLQIAQNQAAQLRAQLQQQLDQATNLQLAVEGRNTLTLAGVGATQQLSLIPQQAIVQPILNDVVVLDQQNTQSVATLQGRSPYGTRYQFQASVNNFRNTFAGDPNPVVPLYQTFAGLTIEQPLLKNFGKDANLADVRVAQLNKKSQILNWQQNISAAVQGVLATYYDMQAALEDMHVREDAIAADSQLVEFYRRRLDLGFATPLDVQQAEVAVSTDRESLLASKNIFLERQFALKRLILQKYEANNPRIFIPERVPVLPEPVINRSEFMSTAFENRYDYRATLIAADVQNVRLKFARNQLLPQLDVIATYGFNGLSTNFSGSQNQIFSADTPQWSVGFNFQVPLGNRQPRAQYNAIAGQKEQAILKVQESELQVNVDVDTVISRIETNRQRVQTARQTRELGEQAVRIAYRRLDEGLISAFDVIDQQRKLYDAKSREIASTAELNKSITQLWLVTGTVLQREGIHFREPTDTIHINPLGVSIRERK